MALSALLGKPISIVNIRANRSKPGLRAQHLAGIELVRDICNGKLEGGQLGSTAIRFRPGKIKPGHYYADPKTAGSTMLLVQVSLPVLLFAGGESVLEIKGGTNAEMAPQLDYTLRVFKPIAERMGVHFECEIIRRGYFPQGGGHLKLTIRPIAGFLVPIQLTEPGQVESIGGYSFVAGNLPGTVLHRMTDEAIKALRAAFPRVHVDITRVKENENVAIGSGVGIM